MEEDKYINMKENVRVFTKILLEIILAIFMWPLIILIVIATPNNFFITTINTFTVLIISIGMFALVYNIIKEIINYKNLGDI